MERNRPANLSDVARAAGVSVATASRVLNGSAHRVTKPLAERVRRAAAELHYAANIGAQSLARSTSSTVALLLHDITDPYFGQIAGGVLAEATRHDVRVLIADTGIDPDSEIAHLDALRGYRPKAVIVAGSRTTDDNAEQRLAAQLRELSGLGAAVVSVGQLGLPGTVVHPGNRDGARLLAEHLISLGHRTFAVVMGPQSLRVVAERRDGFIAGLPAGSPVAYLDGEFSRDGGYAAGRAFAALPQRPSAVFVTGDVMAGGFCTAIREAGMSIPDDLSVAGFDDVPAARDLNPPLTTVRLPLHDMGVKALRAALLARTTSYGGEVIDVECELVVRGSTGPAA